jgi:hypothetical protein
MGTNVPEELAVSVFRVEEPQFDPETGDNKFIPNVDTHLGNFTASDPKRL